ncbi:MAG: precorrin-6y C5,15-methyltransferase (decarboxylating) subunit CbiE [Cyanobacteria bacterium P01_F01_bin.150]
MTGLIYVVGIGLDGTRGLSPVSQAVIDHATVLVGSDRHLGYFPNHSAQRIRLGNLQEAIASIQAILSPADLSSSSSLSLPSSSSANITILVSGDPLFFGLGRLLLEAFPAEQLTFYPHLSSVQLAFNRIKLPWHDASIVSLHGRTVDELIPLLKKGTHKIALLTDGTNTPMAIARLIHALALPIHYQIWVCENLGSDQERIQAFALKELADLSANQAFAPIFAPLNVVILVRSLHQEALAPDELPILGLSDQSFASFSDRPGLMTKREVRTLILGELQLKPNQTIWDIGAGTGSVSIEMARLNPSATIYAIEKTAVGIQLIQTNTQRFQVTNVMPIHGIAPDTIANLPRPDRIFIGGSGGHLELILDRCGNALSRGGKIIIAATTFEHQAYVMQWLEHQQQSTQGLNPDYLTHQPIDDWEHHVLSINLSRSIPIGTLTRSQPLNPVTILVLAKK